MGKPSDKPLHGVDVVITRPAGSAGSLVRRVRALGGTPHRLPGLSLRALPRAPARAHLQAALKDDVLIFTSPAAVRFAARLCPLHTEARVLGVGQGTARALGRAGLTQVHAPQGSAQRSEGLLADPWLQPLHGRRVSLITAPGGRGLLAGKLKDRGARVRAVHLYQRVPPRLDRRHHRMLMQLSGHAWILVTSGQALACLLAALPHEPRKRMLACRAVVSSARLQALAREAGFVDPVCAASAGANDLLAAIRDPR